MKQVKKNDAILQSVQNGVRILQLFTEEKPVWGVTEISRALNIHKSSVSRLINDLLAEGFLRKEKNKYTLGYSLLYLSGVITTHLEIQREAKEPLKKLVELTGETAHIAVLEGTGITYVTKIECQNPVELLSAIGWKNPVSCTSSGKVLLAYHEEDVIREVIAAGLPKMGPNSVVNPELFQKQLKEIKAQGYAVCIDEMHENIVSLAVPIHDYTGEVVAAVSIVGTKERIALERLAWFIDALLETGDEISLNLGYIPKAEKEWSAI